MKRATFVSIVALVAVLNGAPAGAPAWAGNSQIRHSPPLPGSGTDRCAALSKDIIDCPGERWSVQKVCVCAPSGSCPEYF
jgi:hypothetical protein